MPQLNNMVSDYQSMVARAIHAMIIGQTKSGKSDWVAQAVLDGYECLYIDNDNGLATLMEQLGGNEEAMQRVHYVNPLDFVDFVTYLCTATVFKYNERTRAQLTIQNLKPDDKILEMRAMRMGAHPAMLVSIDSWSTLTFAALKRAAKKNGVTLTSIDKYGREIYGPSGFEMTQIAQMLQLAPFNFIVQAHPAIYEIKEKPPNQEARAITEKDMIIRETWEVPQSTSGPHGFSIGRFFNQIGWLELDRFDKFKLSFKQKNRRIGGGTPGGIDDPRGPYRFAKLFGKGITLPSPMNPDAPWIRYLTGEEYLAEQAAAKASAPAATTKPAASPNPQLATTGTLPKLGGIKLGNK